MGSPSVGTVIPVAGLPTLSELRERAAAVLAPVGPEDPPVHFTIDAITPPALLVGWDDPWLTFETPCLWQARLGVSLYASRLEPDAGTQTLETMLGYVIERFRADSFQWPHETTRRPLMVEYNAVPMLTARVIFNPFVSVGGAP